MPKNITVNAQSSIRIAAEKVVYFDPFKITDSLNDADIIFITHEHFDHFSPDDIAKVVSPDTVFAAPASMEKTVLDSGVSKDRLVTLSPGDKTDVLGIPVETVPAYNPGKKFHPRDNGWLGYIVTLDGKRIYVAGDTDATPEAKAVSCDIAMIPIGGTFTMDFREAAEFISELRPPVVIPTHYGSVVGSPEDGESFKKLVDSSIQVVLKL
ncbi:MAG: MBL fold metallo-hydrolase [Oscillospiraceae bacterium]|nr:MBL fold metallo-hydrolase [Oscillospiraceae bacterium]